MFEWLIFLALAVPFSDSPQVDPQLEETHVVVSKDSTAPDSGVKSDEMATPQCCGPNPLPPPGGGQ